MNRVLRLSIAMALTLSFMPAALLADSAGQASAPNTPAPYDAFAKGAQVSSGLLTVLRKNGTVYLTIPKDQLGKDYVETSVPATGIGGFGPAPGEPYIAPARLIRFERIDNTVVIRWPNTFFKVAPNSPQSTAATLSMPSSVVAVTPIAAESDSAVVISAAPFLGDVANLKAAFDQIASNPGHGYRLDSDRSFFTDAKSFPQNTVLRVSQTWTTDSPDTIDTAPDARSIEVKMTYNFIALPTDGYIPRLADARVGYFTQPLIDFQSDRLSGRSVFNGPQASRVIYYIIRWNFMPEHPGTPSVARNPLVYTISNDVPVAYRATITKALLTWNDAFKRIGILDAVKVQQQPSDPAFDPDDIRYNMVSWFDSAYSHYGAEALIVDDPRTGEEINSGVNFDAFAGLEGHRYRYLIAPARGLPQSEAAEEQAALGWIQGTALHESGHDFGLTHNFIGSMAYTARELQDRNFTAKYGVASTVMEYSPTNLWPKGTPNGDYNQTVLGPYDYHAVRYGYEYVPNAATPDAEVPALSQVASAWSDPKYRYAGDEDATFENGHSIDPRVQTDDLTDHPLAWERVQLTMFHNIMNQVDKRFPKPGEPYDEARRAFTDPLLYYTRVVVMPAHIIGGEYISRANAGDPGSVAPLTPVSRGDELVAWKTLDEYLFSDSAWRFSSSVLNKLTYSEEEAFTQATWGYNPPDRHDVSIAGSAANAQNMVLNELFAPLTLQRIDELSLKYHPGTTMTLTDLFDWTRDGIFGDIENGRVAQTGVVRRNAQMQFAKRLSQMWTAPAAGTPTDAQALARLQLVDLSGHTTSGLRGKLDEQSRAHLEALQAVATQALEARATIAAPAQSQGAGMP